MVRRGVVENPDFGGGCGKNREEVWPGVGRSRKGFAWRERAGLTGR